MPILGYSLGGHIAAAMKTDVKIEAIFSELIGTYFLVLTIGLNVLQKTALAPISIGFILMAMVFSTGKVSGAHFNPAVTLGVTICNRGQANIASVCMYVVAQLLGSLGAGFTYFAVLGATFTLQPGEGYGLLDAISVEVLFTAALVFVVLSVATTTQDTGNQYYGLAIGFTLMAAAFAVGTISGCSLNPAVAIGVMFWSHHHTGQGFQHLALYVLSPLAGAVLASVIFRVVRQFEFWHRSREHEV